MFRTVCLLIMLAVNAGLIYELTVHDLGYASYKALLKEKEALQAEVQALEQEAIYLSREIRLLHSNDNYIEQSIRERMNFVAKNEVVYIFADNNAKATARAKKLGARHAQ